jgi:hypothetical protein
MLHADDDLRHDLGSDERARESMVWNVLLPDEELYAIGYITIKSTEEATRLLVVFGGEGEPLLDIAPDVPFEGRDLDEFTLGGMRITQPLRSRAMTASYAGERLGLDYRFDAIHEPFDFERNRDGCAPVAATNRFEQAGRIAGTLTADGREVAFDTTGHRDHSWGVRDYEAILHWKWISAQAGPALAVHAMHTWYQGRQYTNGYVWRDGELSPIVDLRAGISYDGNAMQRSAEIELIDELGRTTDVQADYFAGGFLPFAGVVMAEAGCRVEIAGEPGVGVVELGWQPQYFEYLRGRGAASVV